ncbi:hypothetical protein BC830DRAFT_1143722, partial [Chytriomyces sp. MP71]
MPSHQRHDASSEWSVLPDGSLSLPKELGHGMGAREATDSPSGSVPVNTMAVRSVASMDSITTRIGSESDCGFDSGLENQQVGLYQRPTLRTRASNDSVSTLLLDDFSSESLSIVDYPPDAEMKTDAPVAVTTLWKGVRRIQAFSFIKTPLFTPRRNRQITLSAPPLAPVHAPDSPDSDDFYGSPNRREWDYTSSSDSGSSRDDASSIYSISPAELKPVQDPWESRDWSCFSVKRCHNPRVATTLLSALLKNYGIASNSERNGRSKSVIPRRQESIPTEGIPIFPFQTRSASLAPPAMRKNGSIQSRYSCYSIVSHIEDDISRTTPSTDSDSDVTRPKSANIAISRSKSRISVFTPLSEKRPTSTTPSLEAASTVSSPTSLMSRVKSFSPRFSHSSPAKHLSFASNTSSRYIPRPAALFDYTPLFHLLLAASTPRPHSLLGPLPEPPTLQFSRSMYTVSGRGVRLEVRGGKWLEWEMPVVAGFDLSWETVCEFKDVGCLSVTRLAGEGDERGHAEWT